MPMVVAVAWPGPTRGWVVRRCRACADLVVLPLGCEVCTGCLSGPRGRRRGRRWWR
jgi:hypothetical protein